MQPLLDAAREGFAILLVMHQRKGGGEDGDGLRGSGAFAGAADIVVELERTNKARERVLLALSRYPSTPGSLVVDHDAETAAWSAVGEGERGEARSITDRQAILAALSDGRELTRAELEQTLGTPQRQWGAQLGKLTEEARVQRSGAGKKGDPYRFSMLRPDAVQPDAQHHPVGVQHERCEPPKLHPAPAAVTGSGTEDPDATLRRVTAKFPELAQ
jgi:hypothetical protein